MLKYRAAVLTAAGVLIFGHVVLLLRRYGTDAASVGGDWLTGFAALLATIASWLASRSAGPFGKRVWRLVALSGFLAFAGQVLYTYYYDYLHISLGTVWPSDFWFSFGPCPR